MKRHPQLVLLGARSFLGCAMPGRFREQFDHVVTLSSQECDLTDSAAVAAVAKSWVPGAFILFAAVVNKSVGVNDESYTRNLSMAINVASCARDRSLGGLIYVSSIDVYGATPTSPLREDSPVDPDSWYGRSKLHSEAALRNELGPAFPLAVFRCPGLYDLTERDRSVIGCFTRTARADGEILLLNGGRNRRDFVYAPDLYDLFALWMAQPGPGCWNAATGTSLTMAQIAGQIVTCAGRGRICTSGGDRRDFDLTFDCTSLTRTFGRNPLNPFPIAYPRCAAAPLS